MSRNSYYEQAEADLYRLHGVLAYSRDPLSFHGHKKLA